jgi:hypothetical protein
VRDELFAASAHNTVACVECHTALTDIPHTKGRLLSAGSPAISCAECHAEAEEGYNEGPHGPVAQLGDTRAPACTNCHGNAHYIQRAEDWDAKEQAAACAKCHSGATDSFLGAWPGHNHPSPGFLSIAYFAGLFLLGLTAATLAFGIVLVELEMLQWLSSRVTQWLRDHVKKGASHGHSS